MTFISYAQNFEDVRLWRALQYFENGFYIDVGANDPIHDSVTKAFYDRGWQGINVEPMQNYHDALRQHRPRDTTLQCVASDQPGELTFYGIPDTGLSTADPVIAQERKNLGMNVQSLTVNARTLTSICEEHAAERPIHFLKIDVEGHEETVLRGMDFNRFRPWIILIETPWERDHTWEHLVTDAGYTNVLFDGLNSFFLANEHINLKPAFDLPPCNLDNFQLCKGHNLAHPVNPALETALQRAEQAEAELRAMQNSRAWRAVQKLRNVLRRA
ncbi:MULTISPECIES: FkbM family methyltransferase [Pseudomonas]|uniref:FkbM family methyltransferase n=1 Tax=Pseudomonas TaxID=286 RepID=UPI000A1E143B|nr:MULTISPECIES: FkbM family methyltransferase [Pseudomonas]MCX4218710.1 FkbM family methyltransferase [Pseudomonas sp. MCal1]UIN56802.1 FkbM family methyltransferase [Pseudomonas kribbensis]